MIDGKVQSNLFDVTTDALQTSINMRQLRKNIVAGNIANADTPGYKAQKMDFEDALARAIDTQGLRRMQETDDDHLILGKGGLNKMRVDVYDNPEGKVSNDGNTVDLEREMAEMASNSILYKSAVQLINKKLAALKYAISEGGR